MDDAGFDPLNSDSDLSNDAAAVAEAAGRFNRSDWLYLATGGRQGQAPSGPVGAVYDWAGQVILRSDWTGESVDWAWFDVGPFGSSGHGHYDRLHLSIRSGSQSLLTDSGRFAYVRLTSASRLQDCCCCCVALRCSYMYVCDNEMLGRMVNSLPIENNMGRRHKGTT
jgi:hypothetical protein